VPADIVIIGGGVMGTATAFYLAARGASVTLLERRFIGHGESGHSTAVIRQHYSHPQTARMALDGLGVFRDFQPVTGHPSGFTGCGVALIARAAQRERLQRNVTMQQRVGIAVELLDGAAARAVAPALYLDDELIAFEPDAGYVDPWRVLHGWTEGARAHGAVIREGVSVEAIDIAGGRVRGVRTSEGNIAADAVIVTAGPWATRLLDPIELRLPLTVTRPQIAMLRTPPNTPGLPVIADLRTGMYSRTAPGHLLLVGSLDAHLDDPVPDPDAFDPVPTPAFIQRSRDAIALRVPSLTRAFPWGGYAALYTVSPDAHPLLGPAPGIEGLWLAVGFSGHGFKLSPSVGRGLTEWLLDGAPQAFDAAFFAPDRFARGQTITSAYDYEVLA